MFCLLICLKDISIWSLRVPGNSRIEFPNQKFNFQKYLDTFKAWSVFTEVLRAQKPVMLFQNQDL